MAQLHKFNRLLVVHGIDPNKANVLKVEGKFTETTVTVEYEGVIYKLSNKGKEVMNNIEQKVGYNYIPTKNEIKKPRGWHFRDEFVDSEGNVYHKGIIKPELKGTLPPSI